MSDVPIYIPGVFADGRVSPGLTSASARNTFATSMGLDSRFATVHIPTPYFLKGTKYYHDPETLATLKFRIFDTNYVYDEEYINNNLLEYNPTLVIERRQRRRKTHANWVLPTDYSNTYAISNFDQPLVINLSLYQYLRSTDNNEINLQEYLVLNNYVNIFAVPSKYRLININHFPYKVQMAELRTLHSIGIIYPSNVYNGKSNTVWFRARVRINQGNKFRYGPPVHFRVGLHYSKVFVIDLPTWNYFQDNDSTYYVLTGLLLFLE